MVVRLLFGLLSHFHLQMMDAGSIPTRVGRFRLEEVFEKVKQFFI